MSLCVFTHLNIDQVFRARTGHKSIEFLRKNGGKTHYYLPKLTQKCKEVNHSLGSEEDGDSCIIREESVWAAVLSAYCIYQEFKRISIAGRYGYSINGYDSQEINNYIRKFMSLMKIIN